MQEGAENYGDGGLGEGAGLELRLRLVCVLSIWEVGIEVWKESEEGVVPYQVET